MVRCRVIEVIDVACRMFVVSRWTSGRLVMGAPAAM